MKCISRNPQNKNLCDIHSTWLTLNNAIKRSEGYSRIYMWVPSSIYFAIELDKTSH